jgi:hypothetical protein
VEGEMEELEAWQRYLKENLSFPFEARVSEYQEKGRLRQGDRVKVREISQRHSQGLILWPIASVGKPARPIFCRDSRQCSPYGFN